MATKLVRSDVGGGGTLSLSGARDSEGHRSYRVRYLIQSDDGLDGPANVMQTAGLPTPGSTWAAFDDVDVYAWFRADATIEEHDKKPGERGRFWTMEMLASTKPPDRNKSRCQDTRIEDPLMEPMRVSGSFVKYTEEASRANYVLCGDRVGTLILNSAWEQVRGPQVEFDRNRPQVIVEQNVYPLGLEVFAPMVDGVNSTYQWGLPPRTIKLSNVSWEKKYYGTCSVYYTRRLEFDVRYEGFDRDLLDEGTKVINGHWAGSTTTGTGDDAAAWIATPIPGYSGSPNPDPDNPAHFIRAKDRNGENMRVILDGHGRPYDPASATTGTGDDFPGNIHVEKYDGFDMFVLGIPATL